MILELVLFRGHLYLLSTLYVQGHHGTERPETRLLQKKLQIGRNRYKEGREVVFLYSEHVLECSEVVSLGVSSPCKLDRGTFCPV
jgi:hypothetical protein